VNTAIKMANALIEFGQLDKDSKRLVKSIVKELSIARGIRRKRRKKYTRRKKSAGKTADKKAVPRKSVTIEVRKKSVRVVPPPARAKTTSKPPARKLRVPVVSRPPAQTVGDLNLDKDDLDKD